MFRTTLWSRLEDAQAQQSEAVALMVTSYRTPLIRYLQRLGHSGQDAEDFVQEVFMRLFAEGLLARADRDRGRFRSFLLGITHNIVREQIKKRSAKKRGGGVRPVPLSDSLDVPAAAEDEEAFNHEWASHLLGQALKRLKGRHERQHEVLSLRFEQGLEYAEIAGRLGLTVAQVRNDLHRAKAKLVTEIKAAIAAYSSSEGEYRDEVETFLERLRG